VTDTYRGWNIPQAPTLKKYGLSVEEWKVIIDRQNGLCPIMLQVPSTGRGVIDHEHVKGWAKMPPERKKLYVRGVVSWFANHAYLARGITPDRAARVFLYLEDYEARRPR
jgi:hypothetical protein